MLQAKHVGVTSAECRGATDIVGDAAALPPTPPDAVPPTGRRTHTQDCQQGMNEWWWLHPMPSSWNRAGRAVTGQGAMTWDMGCNAPVARGVGPKVRLYTYSRVSRARAAVSLQCR